MAALQSRGTPSPALPARMPVPTYMAPAASPDGVFSYSAASSSEMMMPSSLTQSPSKSATTHASCTSDTSTSGGLKDSSSLLKHH
ncbi:unnamed protein product [Urochloa humidicola]